MRNTPPWKAELAAAEAQFRIHAAQQPSFPRDGRTGRSLVMRGERFTCASVKSFLDRGFKSPIYVQFVSHSGRAGKLFRCESRLEFARAFGAYVHNKKPDRELQIVIRELLA